MAIEFHHTVPPEVPCSECKQASFIVDSTYLRKYFFSEPIVCSRCKAKIDWWSLLLQHTELRFPFYLFGLVGALNTLLTVRMKPNEVFLLDLSEVQIPPDAHILHLNYTPNGNGLFPLEVHGNTPIRHFTPHKIHLFGRPFGEPAESTPVAISVSWVQTAFTEESWQNLVQAFEAYSIDKFHSPIIPANVAVESRLGMVLQEYYSKFASQDRVEDFLETRATYSYQLNVLLPVLTHSVKFPNLPDHIRGELNRLRDLRNDLAHRGKLNTQLDKSSCAKLVCASVFGFGFVELLEDHLRRAA